MPSVSRISSTTHGDSRRGEVLVAVVNRRRDLDIVHNEQWYRIPEDSVRRLRGAWPPRWVAFFESKSLPGGGSVQRYARVRHVERATRAELFPGEPAGRSTGRIYQRLWLDPVELRDTPIRLVRPRPIAFILTTWSRFSTAETINDLWSDSPREDTLWRALKQHAFPAERQWPEIVAGRRYLLDFAMFCREGNIDVETDGDTYHSGPRASARDNHRQNALASRGWQTLRFNTPQLEIEIDRCIEEIAALVNHLKGFRDDGEFARTFVSDAGSVGQQLPLLG